MGLLHKIQMLIAILPLYKDNPEFAKEEKALKEAIFKLSQELILKPDEEITG